MRPVCTIMIGRLNNSIHVLEKSATASPLRRATADWAGIAAIKKAYDIYQERGYEHGCWQRHTAITSIGPS